MRRDIVVVGGSAGSLDALTSLLRDLPADLPASVFVVIHTAPEAPRVLPAILARQSSLEVAYARDGERIRPGRIVVAPPDQHLFIEEGSIHTSRGPRENRFRPAVDPLFRSAALSYGPRVAGVILSGLLDDGTHGLLLVKRHGGIAIVQDVDDALFSGMPASALAKVAVDHVLSASRMADVLGRLATNGTRPGERAATVRAVLESSALRAAREGGRGNGGRRAKRKPGARSRRQSAS